VDSRAQRRSLDPLLVPFVSAATDDDAQTALSDVMATALQPIVRQVVRRHAAGRDAGPAADGEDVEHSVLLRLTHQLWRQRTDGDEPIENVAAYVARTASNACYERLRERRPQRARLQARLRYVFRHHATLAIWERREGGWACGDRAWRDGEEVLGWPAVAEWRGRISVPASADAGSEAARLVRLAEEIVRTLGAPARLEDVVTLAADTLGIVDDPIEPTITASGEYVTPAAPAGLAVQAPQADEQLDQQRFLERVWREIGSLPVRQRAALLLNLTGPSSQDMLSLIPATGIASWGEIATVLEMAPESLQALVPGLPHDDQTIAGLLQLTRRQVINLRKCARERLARRLGFERGGRAGGRR
jgi:DNA-directed RNA polymerase specialized sigma24 family protein